MTQAALVINEQERFTGFVIGKVTAIYPESNTVDVTLFDGSIYSQVQVMVPFASSRTGIVGLPLPVSKNDTFRQESPLGTARQDESDIFAVVGFIAGSAIRPLVFGFLFPEESELLCGREDQVGNKDGTQMLWKHESNVYVRVAKGDTADKTPDLEISHPSGLFIKIGSDVSLTPIVNWATMLRPFKFKNPESDNPDPAPYVHLSHPAGTYFTVDPEGNITVYGIKDVTITVKGNVNEEVFGDVTRMIHGKLSDTIVGDVAEVGQGKWDKTVTGVLSDKGSKINHDES
jgi:hypothetical protein